MIVISGRGESGLGEPGRLALPCGVPEEASYRLAENSMASAPLLNISQGKHTVNGGFFVGKIVGVGSVVKASLAAVGSSEGACTFGGWQRSGESTTKQK